MNIKGEINRNIVIVGDFDTPLNAMGRPSRQTMSEEMMALKKSTGPHGFN